MTAVVPLFNKEKFVCRAIASVLKQTLSVREVIVVDDGSTDKSAAAVATFLDSRVFVIKQPNGGVSSARNRGIAEARSEWVAFLDADDEWHPNFLQECQRFIANSSGTDAVFVNYIGTKKARPLIKGEKTGTLSDYFAFCVRTRLQGMNCSSSLIKKVVLQQIGGFPEGVRYEEDLDTWTRLAFSGAKIGYISTPYATYHNNTENSATSSALRMALEYRSALERINRYSSNVSLSYHAYRSLRICVWIDRLLSSGLRNEAAEIARTELRSGRLEKIHLLKLHTVRAAIRARDYAMEIWKSLS